MPGTAIFGGSFDPVHNAHLALACAARDAHGLDRILFIPAAHPPHKPQQPHATGEHRMEMIRLAIADEPALDVLDIELTRSGPSYTLLTIRQVRRMIGPLGALYLNVGGDMLVDIPNWWRAADIVREAHIIPTARPGHDIDSGLARMSDAFGPALAADVRSLTVSMPASETSSTAIRARLADGKSIEDLVPSAVQAYVREQGLYAS
jgi:nicotinate-nucleotide adenylyltransferase